METWHADPELLAGYSAGTAGRVLAASVEAHLVTCAACRAAVVPLVDADRLARNLVAIQDRAAELRLHPFERLLQRLGVPERITRVLLVTPSRSSASLAVVAAALAVVAVSGLNSASEQTLFLFLVAAPLLPLAAVTVAFATRTDPLHEIIVAAPTPGIEVFLVRALSVLAPTIGLAAIAAAVVPGQGWEPMLWLLPSAGLTAGALALGSWIPVAWAARILGVAWVAAAAISVRGAPRTDLVERFAAFRPTGQLVLVAAALAATAVVAMRRDAFELAEIRRSS